MAKCTDKNCKCYKDAEPKAKTEESKTYGEVEGYAGIQVDSSQGSVLKAFGLDGDQMQKAARSFSNFVVDGGPNVLSGRDFSWSRAFEEWLESEKFKELEFGRGLSTANYWFHLSHVFYVVREKTEEAIDERLEEKLGKMGDLFGTLTEHIGHHSHGDGSKHSSILKAFRNGKELDPEEAMSKLFELFKDTLGKDKE